MSVEIRVVDPSDQAELRRWWQSRHDAMAGRPCDLRESWEATLAAFSNPHQDFAQTLLAAYDGADGDAELVGTVIHTLPLTDNLSMSYAELTVSPRHRRQGVGTALLGVIEDRARAAGRSYVLSEVVSTPGVVGAGELFAAAQGYPVANRAGLKVLDLHDHPDWAPLEEHAVRRRGTYRIEEWGTRTPDEHAQAVCDALNVFIGMVPMGDLALEDIAMTPERLRRNEQRSEQLGRRRFCAAAFADDGDLVGYSDLNVPPYVENRAEIGLTMVLPGHRGHALGLATKLATHAALQAAVPECGLVTTDNSDANQHMNAVNEAMGYRLVEQVLEVQKAL